MRISLIASALLLVGMNAHAVAPPSNFNLYKANGSTPVTGNVIAATTTRPDNTSTMYASFLFKTTSYFYRPAPLLWEPSRNHMGIILREDNARALAGRGIIIGNVHISADYERSIGGPYTACDQSGTAQVEHFGGVDPDGSGPIQGYTTKLYKTTCLNPQYRLQDGQWYFAEVYVDDSETVTYSIHESTAWGSVIRTLASNVSIIPTFTGTQLASPNTGTNFSFVTVDSAATSDFTPHAFNVEVSSLTVGWF